MPARARGRRHGRGRGHRHRRPRRRQQLQPQRHDRHPGRERLDAAGRAFSDGLSASEFSTREAFLAALLDDEATVKTFRQRDGHTWLLPQNRQYEPILGDHASIMGKVVSVLRAV